MLKKYVYMKNHVSDKNTQADCDRYQIVFPGLLGIQLGAS
jgi:hypothetical protein